MQAQHMPFTRLINVDQGAREHFHVPKYQREYAWKKWQWEQMLADIEDNDPGYFMGSIICVSDTKDITSGDELIFEVVDGQQRLTTLSLLLAAIFAKLQAAQQDFVPSDEDEAEELRSLIANLRSKLVKRKKDARAGEPWAYKSGPNAYFLRVQPSAQNQNLSDYLYLLGEAGALPPQPRPQYCGNRLLGRAYAYFRDNTPDDVAGLSALVARINQLMFVQLSVGSQADAFTLFESLNNRGMPLVAMDIIKNKLLAQMEKKHGAHIDESFERWQGIVRAVPDPNDQDRFLRQFYNAFKHRTDIKVDKVTRATRSVVIRVYETLISRDAAGVFDQLTMAADIYSKLLRAEFDDGRLADSLVELERINSTPAYIVLLYLYSLDGAHFQQQDSLRRMVDLLVRFFLRRNVTDKPPTRQVDQAMIDLVEACAARIEATEKIGFGWFHDELVKHAHPASLAEFRAALGGDIYNTNSWMARYVLIQVDRLHHSREYRPDLWLRDDKGRFVWTVEHVLPQAERLPDHWVQLIAGGDRVSAAEVQDRWVHSLGNLTLSGYNSDLATAAFHKKQELARDRSFLGHKINIGYRNGLALNSMEFASTSGQFSLANAPRWDAAMIEARTEHLVNMVLAANLLPGERTEET